MYSKKNVTSKISTGKLVSIISARIFMLTGFHNLSRWSFSVKAAQKFSENASFGRFHAHLGESEFSNKTQENYLQITYVDLALI